MRVLFRTTSIRQFLREPVTEDSNMSTLWQKTQTFLLCDRNLKHVHSVTENSNMSILWQKTQTCPLCDRRLKHFHSVTEDSNLSTLWQKIQTCLLCDRRLKHVHSMTENSNMTTLWQKTRNMSTQWQKTQTCLLCDKDSNMSILWQQTQTCPLCDRNYNSHSLDIWATDSIYNVVYFILSTKIVKLLKWLGERKVWHTCLGVCWFWQKKPLRLNLNNNNAE